MNNAHCGAVFLVLITPKKHKDVFIDTLTQMGGCLINAVYCRDGCRSGYFRDALGLVPEENKVMLVCLLARDKADTMLNTLVEKYNFGKPGTGRAFTVRVDKILAK